MDKNTFHYSFRYFLFLVLVLVLSYSFYPNVLPESANSDSPRNQAQKILRYDASAVVKLVPVRVLDQNRHPVNGLRKEDFSLFDNNEPKVITEFEIHNLEDGILLKNSEKAPPLSTAPSMKRKFFLFFDFRGSDMDFRSIDATGPANAKKLAIQFVETKLLPGDDVSVLYFARMTGLNMTAYAISDKAKINKAIERAREVPPSPGFVSRIDRGDEEESEGIPGFAVGSNTVVVPGLGFFGRNRDFNTSMVELAKAMNYIPGNKNLVIFSLRSFDNSKTLEREFGASNTTVFIVNTRNVKYLGPQYPSARLNLQLEEQRLREFALATGGQYFSDIKDIEPISEEIQTLSGNYYVLGYYVDEKWDGRYHEIKVEVKKPDFQVFVQKGYNNPKAFSERSDNEKRFDLFDVAYSDKPVRGDVLDMPVEPLFCLDFKGSNCVILSKLLVDEKLGIPPGHAELYVYIFDKDHKAVQARRWEIDLTRRSGETFFPYSFASLAPGDYECRVIVRDLEAGHMVAGRAGIRVPKAESLPIKFFSPLIMVVGKEPKFLKLSVTRNRSTRDSSLIRFYPLIPKESYPLVRNLEPGEQRLLAVLPVEYLTEKIPEMNFRISLSSSSESTEIPVVEKLLDFKTIEKRRAVFIFGVSLPDLNPGDYKLSITATEVLTRSSYLIETSFEIK